MEPETPKVPFDEGLLQFIYCPLTKGKFTYNAEERKLVNAEFGITFPVNDQGIALLSPRFAELKGNAYLEQTAVQNELAANANAQELAKNAAEDAIDLQKLQQEMDDMVTGKK